MLSTRNLTPGTVLSGWHDYADFSQSVWPSTGIDWCAMMQAVTGLKDNASVASPSFRGKVVIVTGAGAG